VLTLRHRTLPVSAEKDDGGGGIENPGKAGGGVKPTQ